MEASATQQRTIEKKRVAGGGITARKSNCQAGGQDSNGGGGGGGFGVMMRRIGGWTHRSKPDGRKFTLDQIFSDANDAGAGTAPDNNNTAKSRKKLDKWRKRMRSLVARYAALEGTKPQQSAALRDKLIRHLDAKVAPLTPDELGAHAAAMDRAQRCFEAILFYEVCAVLAYRREKPDRAVAVVADCISELFGTALALAADAQRQHVLPLMRELLRLIRRSDGADAAARCVSEARALRVIGVCEGLIGRLDAEESTALEAIRVMEATFGAGGAAERKAYSGCLCSLANAYKNQARYHEAAAAYARAVAADRRALDYASVDDQKKSIWLAKQLMEDMNSKLSGVDDATQRAAVS